MKGIGTVTTILLAVGLVALGSLAVIPGLGESLWTAVTKLPVHCSITPYDSGCYCYEEQVKMGWEDVNGNYMGYQVDFSPLYGFYWCEPYDRVIDLSDPNWEQHMKDYAQDQWHTLCNQCDNWNCPGGELMASFFSPTAEEPRPIAIVECNIDTGPTSRREAARMWFYTDTGEIYTKLGDTHDPYCNTYTNNPSHGLGDLVEHCSV